MFSSRPLFCALLFTSLSFFAQQNPKIHSHNDYSQHLPFWRAYNSGLNSIEVDVFLKNGVLFATHAENEIIATQTLETL